MAIHVELEISLPYLTFSQSNYYTGFSPHGQHQFVNLASRAPFEG